MSNGLPSLISFGSPPPSPVQTVTFADTSVDLPVSPKRKFTEKNHLGRRGKRHKENNVMSTSCAIETLPGYPLSEEHCLNKNPCPQAQAVEGLVHSNHPPSCCSEEGSVTKFDLFVESVLAEECAFWQLSRTLFVVNGWDAKLGAPTPAWYHLHQVSTSSGKSVVCMCPQGKDRICFHIRFIRERGEEMFSEDLKMPTGQDTVYLFSRYALQDTNSESGGDMTKTAFHNVFSVPSTGSIHSVKTRVVVEYYGDDTGSGKWTCAKEPRVTNCGHIMSARNSLQQHILQDINAKDTNVIERDVLKYSENTNQRSLHQEDAVSYQAIPPFVWARISSDRDQPMVTVIESPPKLIPLDSVSSCCCRPGSLRSLYDASKPSIVRSCEVYGLTRMWNVSIQLQKCPLCKHRFIGPDCLEIGLFNWNNRMLFIHDLLEDYTSSYCTSETPFVAWVTVVARRYESHKSPAPFVSDKKFRSVWFSYAKLLNLNNDMTCPECGPTPRATVWDGVTLAFNRKHILPSLRPPTVIHARAPIRENARYPITPQYIEHKVLRKSIRSIVETSTLHLKSLSNTSLRTENTDRFAAQSWCKSVSHAIEDLSIIDESLTSMFTRSYSVSSLRKKGLEKCPDVYNTFFMQLSAEESALQLTPRPILEKLRLFISNPLLSSVNHLTGFPALYNLLVHEFSSSENESIAYDTYGVCRWILTRGLTVLYSMLLCGSKAEKDVLPSDNTGHWLQTGSCYSIPQIRHRPFYPKLANDGQLDKGGKDSKGEGCQKHYLTYGQHRLTGGLMVVWCTHSICYGFHCIPVAEGRNEVFSAIYTHWEKAPELVIYDFACSLQPYCMAREPDFFADTSFLIDHFHSSGHSKCGKASFLSNYIETNSHLLDLNSSAGECGNKGLLRIRKSVSYMSQERAIIYTKVYLSYWNRSRIQAIEKRKL